ncbi:hypothetical protein GCM10027429_31010 [Marivirga atlantica]|jgi:hypothetical protein|uniref:DUF4252 domain-containing protein n=1 Tax=Marivirga atlantica TaxID=1548457 RepID=A0A937AD84_9BACT|nr:DUF4252 domain-containing protein [Marivirga atlantica]MBL0766680.1 DUF4252 domain-containing protein [Marivirga atlantica]
MKKVIVIVAFCLLGNIAFAQNSEFINFYNKYSTNQDFTVVSVNERMISLFSNLEADNPEDQAALDAVSKIKGIKLIANQKTNKSSALYGEAKKAFERGYDELMVVRDKDSNMQFLIKESGGKISELVMLVGSDSSFVAASIYGDIDLKQMSKMGKSLNISGMENLKQLEDMDE